MGDQHLSPLDLAQRARDAITVAIATTDLRDRPELVAQLAAIIATAEQAGTEINVKAAAYIAGRSEGTIRAWIARHRIGVRRGGRFVVFHGRLSALLADVAREGDDA